MMELMCFLAVLFVANTIQIITGFAGNLIAMPLSILLIGYDEARVSINIFTLIACGILSFCNKETIRWYVLARVLIYVMFGMLAAMILQPYLPQQHLRKCYGVFLFIIVCYKLVWKRELPKKKGIINLVAVMAGVLHGLFLSGGALLALILLQQLKDKKEFRVTISTVWVILDALLMVEHAFQGLYTPQNITYILFSLPCCILSVFLGNKIFHHVNPQCFETLTYGLLCFSAACILWT